MFDEDDLLPISALSHLIFCERRAALLHVEGEWADNAYTVEGVHLHEQVDEEGRREETRGDLRITRGIHLRSLRLGLSGRADVVEFHRRKGPGGEVQWAPFPVEYKRGGPKPDASDEVQLCAQALCLEEMLGRTITAGALFYHETRHRLEVPLTRELRAQTEGAAGRLREIVLGGGTPRALPGPRCRGCSIREACLPHVTDGSRSVGDYLERLLEE